MEKERYNKPIEDAVSTAMGTQPKASSDLVFIYWEQ